MILHKTSCLGLVMRRLFCVNIQGIDGLFMKSEIAGIFSFSHQKICILQDFTVFRPMQREQVLLFNDFLRVKMYTSENVRHLLNYAALY